MYRRWHMLLFIFYNATPHIEPYVDGLVHNHFQLCRGLFRVLVTKLGLASDIMVYQTLGMCLLGV